MRTAACLLSLFVCLPCVADEDVNRWVLAPSVYIEVPTYARGPIGSGTVFTSQKDHREYVVTAGHVVDVARKVIEVDVVGKDGIVERKRKEIYAPVMVGRTVLRKGKVVGDLRLQSEVVFCSLDEDAGGMDVAVLRILENEFKLPSGVTGDSTLLGQGDAILHSGSLYGNITGALCKGSVSRLDYVIPNLNNASFMVVELTAARPGSSGGGIFVKTKDGYQWVGMVVRGDSAGLMLVKTSETVLDLLRKHDLDHCLGCGCPECLPAPDAK